VQIEQLGSWGHNGAVVERCVLPSAIHHIHMYCTRTVFVLYSYSNHTHSFTCTVFIHIYTHQHGSSGGVQVIRVLDADVEAP
jgi:hypothetical protein